MDPKLVSRLCSLYRNSPETLTKILFKLSNEMEKGKISNVDLLKALVNRPDELKKASLNYLTDDDKSLFEETLKKAILKCDIDPIVMWASDQGCKKIAKSFPPANAWLKAPTTVKNSVMSIATMLFGALIGPEIVIPIIFTVTLAMVIYRLVKKPKIFKNLKKSLYEKLEALREAIDEKIDYKIPAYL